MKHNSYESTEHILDSYEKGLFQNDDSFHLSNEGLLRIIKDLLNRVQILEAAHPKLSDAIAYSVGRDNPANDAMDFKEFLND